MTSPNVLDGDTTASFGMSDSDGNPFAGIDLSGVEEDPSFVADGKYRCYLFEVKPGAVKKESANKGKPYIILRWKVAPDQKFAGVIRDEMLIANMDDSRMISNFKRGLKRLGMPESSLSKIDLNEIRTFVGDEYFVTFKKNGDYININGVEMVNPGTLAPANGGQVQQPKVDLTSDM